MFDLDNKTMAEVLGKLFESLSPFMTLVTMKVVNDFDLAEQILGQTMSKASVEILNLGKTGNIDYFSEENIKKIVFGMNVREIYNALDPMEFSFNFCEISEDIVDFEANLKNDLASQITINKYTYKDEVRRLNVNFKALPPQQKLALMMFYFLNMSISDIAVLFNVKELKAKSIVADARKKLNTSMQLFTYVCVCSVKTQKPIHITVDDMLTNSYYEGN